MSFLRRSFLILAGLSVAVLLGGSSVHDASPDTSPNGQVVERLVEWQRGDAPIVISVPHGGSLRPKDIATRTFGKTVRDGQTLEIGLALVEAIRKETGKRPHLIVCHLHRSKLDANRDLHEAAQGDAKAELAWKEYHEFIERARAEVVSEFGSGLYVDLHGQSHAEGWIEWGYTLSSKTLASGELDQSSSLASLVKRSENTLAELVRGPTSLGARTQRLGYKSVPSPAHPDPDGGGYYSGGYSVRRHGSLDGGTIDGVQLELPRALRMARARHDQLGRDLARALLGFLDQHYQIEWAAARNASGTGEPARPGSSESR